MARITITLDHNDAVLLYGSAEHVLWEFRDAGNVVMERIWGELCVKLYEATGGRTVPNEAKAVR